MKKFSSKVGNIQGRGDHKCKGSVAGASMHVSGNDSELEWLECREESLEQGEAGDYGRSALSNVVACSHTWLFKSILIRIK